MSTIAGQVMSEICRRIKRSVAKGQALEGMTFYEDISIRSEKHDDLPRVYIISYSDTESHGGGGPQSGKGINSVLRNSGTILLQLVVDKRNGWLTGDTVTSLKKMGLVNVKNLLLDAMETDDAGEVDCSLGGRTDAPLMFTTKESGIFDLGLIMDVEITLPSIRIERGTRSRLVATQPSP